MKLKSIITISGRISSGKSYAAKMIHCELGFPIASFGGYLKYYCEQNNLSTNRKTLQDTGESFVKANAKQFLIDVLSHIAGESNIIVLEGLRHRSILKEIKELTDNHLSVFVEADLQTRYKRYLERNKDSDLLKTFEQFKIVDSHNVEFEIESLKSESDLTVDSTKDYSITLFSYLKTNLKT